MGQTITRFALRKGHEYYNDNGDWGPIYEAKTWKANPYPHIPEDSIVVLLSITIKEEPWEVTNHKTEN